jgi:subtilisin-like proprotein convertase family protein
MFAKIINRSTRRSGTRRRALVARNSLLAAMSVLTLSMTVAEPMVDASPNSRNERESRERSERRSGRTATRTFSSSVPVTINALTTANPYPSAIPVSNFRRGSTVTDVNVVLQGLTHAYADDIDVLLVAPDGNSTILMSDVGGNFSPAGITLTFDDQAPNIWPDEAPLVGGTYKPANYGPLDVDSFPSVSAPSNQARLARFNGKTPNGEWRLYVVDDEGLDGGAFNGGWSLQLTTERERDSNRRRRDRR